MNGKLMLYVDQFGNHFFVYTIKELRNKIGMGGSKVSKMYHDFKDGTTRHVGYVIGNHWLHAYTPYAKQV